MNGTSDINIAWVTTANLNNIDEQFLTGGHFYEIYLMEILKKHFPVNFIRIEKLMKEYFAKN